jgi:two-component system CheB/CheR fusion protein
MAAKKPARRARRSPPRSGAPRRPRSAGGDAASPDASRPAGPGRGPDGFPVVGIGASAGGLEAFSELLSRLPPDVPLAIVLVQHLDPTHSSLLTELLTRTTPMPVIEVRPGTRVEPSHVYVIPPNTTMTIQGGILQLSPRASAVTPHMPIDIFFRSLAEDVGDRAIGVVLSGSASDGALGIKAIKGEGGVTFVQEPETAGHDGMPRSALASGAVDFVLPPRGIAQELARIGHHPYLRDPRTHAVEGEATDERALDQIYRALLQESGVDFRLYRQTTIRRRIARRMLVHKIDTLDRYRRYLDDNRPEIQALYNEMLINVTRFFRDAEAFEALQGLALPRLVGHRSADQTFRVWVPGCATGEEAYSLAMVLVEALDRAGTELTLQVFGTDVSEAAVGRARSGVYPSNIELDVSPDRLRRFFTKIDGQYQVKKSLRDLCIFARHNLAKDPPFSGVDIVSCRNMLIYLDAPMQRRIMGTFHYALRNTGILLLGGSETIGPLTDLFTVVDKTNKLYARKATSTRLSLGSTTIGRSHGERERPRPGAARMVDVPRPDVQRDIDRILLNRYAPAAVLINGAYEILQFRGHTSPYLEPAQGHASLNVIKMARGGLLVELRAAILTAGKRKATVRREGLHIKQDRGGPLRVNLEVIPLRGSADETNFLVVFERAPTTRSAKAATRARGPRRADARDVERLDQELAATKEFLQSIIEDREAANEELRSANEELQSSNEELQSTNEELETAKEELQSVNEELTTVNDELQHRNAELAQLNNDTNNLVASVNIPIVILTNDLRIRRFTPMAGRLFNLLPIDVGRPIAGVRGHVEVPELEQLCAEVVETMTPVTRDVRDRDGGWHSLRIRPYRTAENQIDGAVVTLIDISVMRNSLDEVAAARDYAESIVETVRTPLVILDGDGRVRSANRAFYETFQTTVEQTGNRMLSELGNGQWSLPALRRALEDVIERGTALDDFEVEHEFPTIGARTMVLSARPLRVEAAAEPRRAILLSIEDITPRRRAERELRASEEVRYRRLFETAKDGIVLIDAESELITTVNPYWTELTGQPRDAAVGCKLWEIGVFQDADALRSIVLELRTREFMRYQDLTLTRDDGTVRHVELACNVYHLGGRRIIQCVARDITDRMELLERERTARAEAEAANRAKDDFLSVLSHELRTPLTAMLGWARVLRKGTLDGAKTDDALETIERNTRLLAQLIEDLLDVSRIAAGKLAIEVRRIDLGPVVRAAVETIRESAAVKELELEVGLPETPAIARGDHHRLQQVVWNLLSNAVKFTPKGGQVTVTLEPSPTGTRLVVSDSGRGISPQLLPRIFDRFRQGESVVARTQGGLGLGLAIVRHLVELHGGRVHAFSAGEGSGSTFTIELPPVSPSGPTAAEDESSSASTDAPADDVRLDGLRVLIVEDERDTGRMLAQVLGERGADVIHVETSAAALSTLERSAPDVVLSDIGLPGEDGYELLRQIRSLPSGNRLPAIALSAFAREQDVQRAIGAGFDVHLAKPIEPGELARVVAQIARARG